MRAMTSSAFSLLRFITEICSDTLLRSALSSSVFAINSRRFASKPSKSSKLPKSSLRFNNISLISAKLSRTRLISNIDHTSSRFKMMG